MYCCVGGMSQDPQPPQTLSHPIPSHPRLYCSKLKLGGSFRAELSPLQATLSDDGRLTAERLDIKIKTGAGARAAARGEFARGLADAEAAAMVVEQAGCRTGWLPNR